MFLIDTNVVSEMRKVSLGRGDANVARWAQSVKPPTAFMSVITVLELEIGIARLAPRDPAQASVLRDWLEQGVMPRYAGRTLPITEAVARRAAQLLVADRKLVSDSLIAATALVHGLTVVTRNVGDFRACPTLNPFA